MVRAHITWIINDRKGLDKFSLHSRNTNGYNTYWLLVSLGYIWSINFNSFFYLQLTHLLRKSSILISGERYNSTSISIFHSEFNEFLIPYKLFLQIGKRFLMFFLLYSLVANYVSLIFYIALKGMNRILIVLLFISQINEFTITV